VSADVVLRTENLRKHYGRVRAVDGIDLEVRRGEVYAFLGRNGAGKTTTIRILLGLIRPTAGTVHVFGRPIGHDQEWLRRVGFLVESATAYPNLTVTENLDLQRRLTGASRASVDEVVERLGLGSYADRRAGRLSLGNKQRLSLARALLHTPEMLVLDEPANALDPAGIVEVRHLLRSLADRGVTVFMSSHILAEVAHLADRIGIVDAGRLVEEAPRDVLAARAREYVQGTFTEEERREALLTADLERYFLARTSPEETR
jgi:ABC-type multidrug transport system ATPase subunit